MEIWDWMMCGYFVFVLGLLIYSVKYYGQCVKYYGQLEEISKFNELLDKIFKNKTLMYVLIPLLIVCIVTFIIIAFTGFKQNGWLG